MTTITDATRAAMERNLRILPWWWVLRWAWFGEAIWVIYLTRERGLTIGEVLVFEAVFSAIAIVAEVPTGMVADRFGRRISLVLATLSLVVTFLAFGFASTIPLLIGAYGLIALSDTFMSGADNAFLFDTLQRLGRQDEFARRVGRMNAVQAAVLAAFTVAGGAMVRWTPLSAPILISALFTAPAVLLALTLKEPPHEDGIRPSFLGTGRGAARRVLRRPSMWLVMLLTTFTTIPLMLMAITIQPVIVGYGVPLWTLGIFVGAQMMLSSAGSWASSPVGNRLGLRRTLRTMSVLSAVALFGGASGVIWLFPLFIVPAVAFYVIHPHVADYLSRRTPSAERATVLSIGTLSERVMGIPTVLLMAAAVDRAGLGAALGGAGVVLLMLVAVSYVAWARSGDTEIDPIEPPAE